MAFHSPRLGPVTACLSCSYVVRRADRRAGDGNRRRVHFLPLQLFSDRARAQQELFTLDLAEGKQPSDEPTPLPGGEAFSYFDVYAQLVLTRPAKD